MFHESVVIPTGGPKRESNMTHPAELYTPLPRPYQVLPGLKNPFTQAAANAMTTVPGHQCPSLPP
jgi:hypothetical protein